MKNKGKIEVTIGNSETRIQIQGNIDPVKRSMVLAELVMALDVPLEILHAQIELKKTGMPAVSSVEELEKILKTMAGKFGANAFSDMTSPNGSGRRW